MSIRKRRSKLPVTRIVRGMSYLPTSKLGGYTAPLSHMLKAVEESKQFEDPFLDASGGGTLTPVEPPFKFTDLAKLPLQSNILKQCIESLVVNIDSYGFILEFIGEQGTEDSDEVQEEKRRLSSFLGCPSARDLTFRQVREYARWDKETIGNAFYEIIRNQKGEITLMDHIPGTTMRLTKHDKEVVAVEQVIRNTDTGEYTTRTVNRKFRRYVHVTSRNRKKYFKEFGDPRRINPDTGEVDNGISVEASATEVYHDFFYVPGAVYGLPRWIGQLPALLGSRESEIVNLNFFRENAIPAMAVLVSGGGLTQQTFNRLEQYMNAVRGQDAMQRIMIIEATSDESAGSVDHSQPAPRVEIKPMISERQQEGLFQEYDNMNTQRVRSSFRLPPIFVGRAEDYTRATANASILTAENQIFVPERLQFDDFMNNKVLITFRPRFWKFKSIGPSMTEPESLATILDAFGKQGALTPNIVIKLANEVLDVKIDTIEDEWGDAPFPLIIENIRQGNTIDGFENFIEVMDETGNDNEGNNNILPFATKKMIRREISCMVSDLRDELQTSAKREVAKHVGRRRRISKGST